MSTGGEAAEQTVRLSLEGAEVVVKITGEALKNLAILLVASLRKGQKTRGKARLTSMLKSGKDLTVFSLQNRDLKKFVREAKKYGVLYCVLKEKDKKDPLAEVDIITREEDAARIQRILERFRLGGTVDKARIAVEPEKENRKDGTKDFFSKAGDDRPSGRGFGERSADRLTASEKKPSVRKKLETMRQARPEHMGSTVRDAPMKTPGNRERGN